MSFYISNIIIDQAINDIENSGNFGSSGTGPTGANGSTGPTGPDGISITGPTGPDGISITGPTGPDGISITGPTGPAGSSANNWLLTGNTGTNPSSNFIGTIDDQPLIIKVNNISAGIIGNTGTYNNTSFGYQSCMSGNFNSAFGFQAISNQTGDANSAFGFQALNNQTNGYFNTAIGHLAMSSLTTGESNVAIGNEAMNLCLNGFNNVVIGSGAMSIYGATGITGSNNIVIGSNAQLQSPSGINSNEIRIGDGNIVFASCNVTWAATSDRNLKSDIKNSDLGLEFIDKLNPVSYYRKNDDSKKIEYGFIAQEIEEVLNSTEVNNTGIISKSSEGIYNLRYNDFIPILTKAIQEQNIIIKKQQKNIKKLKKMLKMKVDNYENESVNAENQSVISEIEKEPIKEESILTTCQYIFTKGKNVGKLCDKKTDTKFCKIHTK